MPLPTPTRAPRTAPTRPVVDPDARPDLGDGDGDHDRFKHYVSERELQRSSRRGTPVTALCGKRWVPSGDPGRYPMCPTCAELAAERLTRDFGG
jgi:hypothetical protein